MGVFARYRELNREQRALLARAAVWLMLARLGLAVLPFPRVRALCARASTRRSLKGRSASEIRWAVLAAARRLPGVNCLPRALVLQALLQQAGIASDLRIGVATDPQKGLTAHAWVDCDGKPFLADEDLSPYTPLAPLPS